MMTKPAVLLGLVLLASGCRPDPGTPDYEDSPFSRPDAGGDGPDNELLPGPFPYESGKRRLMVGVFYETGRSEEVLIDNAVTHVFLYESTVNLESSTDHIEGKQADTVVHAGKAWLGFGVHWDEPRNLDAWKFLHVSLKSADPGFASVAIGMNDANKSVQLDATKYGYKNDGEWHHVSIPFTDFVGGGLGLATIKAPFVLIAGSGAAGNKLLLDNLYFTTE